MSNFSAKSRAELPLELACAEMDDAYRRLPGFAASRPITVRFENSAAPSARPSWCRRSAQSNTRGRQAPVDVQREDISTIRGTFLTRIDQKIGSLQFRSRRELLCSKHFLQALFQGMIRLSLGS